MTTIFLGILFLILLYALLPNLYFRILSKRVIKKLPSKNNNIALTFDDGPDPLYTPRLLDLLRKNNITCTFFVIAEKALKYPDLINRISSEGHEIGLHSLSHKNQILLSPKQTEKDFINSLEIMKKLGVHVKLFRPPWGLFNPLTYYYANALSLKVVLWSMHTLDWSNYVTIDYIKRKLLNKAKAGNIILLHDGSNGKATSKKTIDALEEVLPILREKGFSFIKLINL